MTSRLVYTSCTPPHEHVEHTGHSAVICANTSEPIDDSRCRLGRRLAWAQDIVCYMGVQMTHLKGQFWWIGAPIVNYTQYLPLTVQKRLNRSICRLGCGLEWAEGCTNSIAFARWRQCALMGGYVAVTCRITLNHPSTVVTGDAPYVKLL